MKEVEKELEQVSLDSKKKLQLKVAIADMVFEQHMQHQSFVNTFLCGIQVMILILNVILDLVFDKNISSTCCVCELLLVIIISVNILIGEHTWNKTKNVSKNIDRMIDDL